MELLLSQSSFAQGSLTPPGAPAPTMKTLDQIEPRTAIINATSVTINTSGSYYLTANINVTGGTSINITANNVTLDLNGFTVSSTAPSATGTGILLASGLADITILNGHIKGGVTNNAGVYSGSGFANGISYIGSIPSNVRVAGVSVSGCLTNGIYLNIDNSTVVESCTVQTVGSYGIVAASVSRSTAYPCGSAAVHANVASDCYGYGTGTGYGVYVTTANNCQGYSTGSGFGVYSYVANNCYGSSSSGTGLASNTANNCYGYSASGTGLSAASAVACYGTSPSGGGVTATTADNCQGYITGNGFAYAMYATTANNCYGYSAGMGIGILATTANNCYGRSGGSGRGVDTYTANNCYGQSSSGTGLSATSLAIGCFGLSSTGMGLIAFIANSCDGSSISVVHKYNMP